MRKNKVELLFNDSQNSMRTMSASMSGYKIQRLINGEKMDIELSSQELSQAFYVQDHRYHIEDVVNILEEYENDDKLHGHTAQEIRDDTELMEIIVDMYVCGLEDYDTGWRYAARDAINDGIEECDTSLSSASA